MNEPRTSVKDNLPLPKAKIRRARPAWLLWLVPLAAAALCGWFVYRDFVATGPLITIDFQSAEGVEAGNTDVKYRGAQIGRVKSTSLSQDQSSVRVKVRLISSAKGLARKGTVFWIVRPEVKIGGLTGLRTLISGEYIDVLPGSGAPATSFVGADKQPMPEEPNALKVILLAPNLSSLREHSPIFYRGIQVGEVVQYQLAPHAQEVVIRARIHEEYGPLVRLNSKFWNAGGINFAFSLFRGAKISAESPETLFGGGVEFATPNDPQAPVTNGATFVLNEKPEDDWKKWSPRIKLRLPAQAPETVTPENLK